MKVLLRKAVKGIRVLKLLDPLTRRALLRGVAASVEHKSIISSINRIDLLVDVGANKGQFSLLVKSLLPSCRVVAFEPLPGEALHFKELFRGDSSVKLVPAALGQVSGREMINISKSPDSSSLLGISSLQAHEFPGTAAAGTSSIDVVRLDQVLVSSDFCGVSMLKIDVQGYELEVIRGCGDMLKDFDYIYVECSFVQLYDHQPLFSEVHNCLESNGFSIGGIENLTRGRSGGLVQADFLYIGKH